MAPEPSTFASALDDALRAAFGESVDAVSIQTLGDGVGLLATLTRVELRDGMRVVVKAPTSDPGNRAIAHRFGYYAREAGTYHSLLPRPGIRAPECFAVVNGVDGPVIVLEDLGDLRAGDQVAGASVADAFAAADLLGALHAAFWNDPVLAACSWLPGPTDEVVRGYRTLFELTWDTFRDRVRGLVPDPHLAAAERAIGWFDSVCDAFAHAPRTLVHGDFRLDNLLFDDDGRATAVDWQLAAWGRGAYDLALFAAGSLDPEVRREIELALVRRYHDALRASGVRDYSLDECERDYRWGHVLNLPNPVTALVAVSGGNERGRQMLTRNAQRALAAMADHEPFLGEGREL